MHFPEDAAGRLLASLVRDRMGRLDHFDVLEKIKGRLPGFPLVMHGSSSVPKEEVDRINAAGGKIAGSMGVDPNEYLPAARLGVTKVNIDTDGRLVWTRVHREFFRDKPAEFDFRPPGKIFIEEYAKFIASRNQLLGSAGQLPAVRAAFGGDVVAHALNSAGILAYRGEPLDMVRPGIEEELHLVPLASRELGVVLRPEVHQQQVPAVGPRVDHVREELAARHFLAVDTARAVSRVLTSPDRYGGIRSGRFVPYRP